MARTQGAQLRNNNAVRHGLHSLQAAIREVGAKPLDGRSAISKALQAYKRELVDDLGTDLTTAQMTLVDLAAQKKLMVDTAVAWIAQNLPVVVSDGDVRFVSLVKEAESISMNLARILDLLGLERKAKPISALTDYLETRREPVGPQPS